MTHTDLSLENVHVRASTQACLLCHMDGGFRGQIYAPALSSMTLRRLCGTQ
uniref:Uncharacterized protein n=1 Tax=Triticum urartu TaxID=4572 RepID=A0A8R7TNM7_TRIUA